MDFGWNKLVTPLTNPAFIGRMKELDVKFTSMKSEMFGVAKTVDTIDWASYEKSIENKALVAQMKKEYENLKFAAPEGEDLTKINADIDFAIEKASTAAEISKAEIPKVKAQLARAIEEKRTIHNWSAEDYFARYPGLEEQLREEYMQGEFLPSEAEERLEAQDVNEARKQFKLGQPITVPEDMPDRVGDFSVKAEQKKVDDLLNRMFAGSKQYQQLKEAEAAAAKKRAAAHHH